MGGFYHLILTFTDRPAFLIALYGKLIAHPRSFDLIHLTSSVLNAIHEASLPEFRQCALTALRSGNIAAIHAAANNLRVFERATEEDVSLIQEYGAHPDPIAKRGALLAIAHMGKFTDLLDEIKVAALTINAEGNSDLAGPIADAFGPYGVLLTGLSRVEAKALAAEFLHMEDWGSEQGAIPRFLNRFVVHFPDETVDLLIQRIELSSKKGRRQYPRTFDFLDNEFSFESVPQSIRTRLGQYCIVKLVNADSTIDQYAELFWVVAGSHEPALQLLLEAAEKVDTRGVRNLTTLILHARPRLAFTNTAFAKQLLLRFSGEERKQLVEAFANQVRRPLSGAFWGNIDDHLAQEKKRIQDEGASFSGGSGLEDLTRAIRGLS